MDLSAAPAFISAKLAALSDARATAAVRADQLARELASLRDRWDGRVQRSSDVHTDFPKLIDAALAEQTAVSSRLTILGHIIDNARRWLAQLPANATLEQVTPEIDTGLTIPAARERIKRLEASVAALKQVPLPSVDIKQRVESYVASLTQPVIKGVAAGQQLSVTWPGPPSQFAAIPHVDLFTMVAFLEPEKFAERLLASIHKNAPPADRDEQIKDLEQEIERLQRIEEVLVTSTGADRVDGRPPEVVLQCRIVTPTRGKVAA